MTVLFSRRNLLATFASVAVASAVRAGGDGRYGPSAPFSFEALAERARAMSQAPFAQAPSDALADHIDYNEHTQIHTGASSVFDAAWNQAVTPFHVGKFFRKPVRIHVVEGGVAREVLHRSSDFDIPAGNPALAMAGKDVFAGFRIHENRKADSGDWLAFLGASYFRSSGDGRQYGISARGVAIDAADPEPPFREDFPDFTSFWLEETGPDRMRIYALLDGASVAGAFQIDAVRSPKVVMDVKSTLFPRREIHRLGIAPMSSMFWYGKINRWIGNDIRQEVHDSDGLAIWSGAGEQIWRPLNNPPRIMTSTFTDDSPRAFGLMQRERSPAVYDDDIHFERRPDLIVEPVGQWGRGSIQLIEIPTIREYDDNVVVHWTPEKRARAGDRLDFAYRLHWAAGPPFPGDVARCTGTRLDLGTTTETSADPALGGRSRWRQFVVDFSGDILAGYDPRQCVPAIEMSRGRNVDVGIWPAADGNQKRLRLWFSFGCDGGDPVEMRAYVRGPDGRVLTETWLYQYHPLQSTHQT